MKAPKKLSYLALACAALSLAPAAWATPYASCITNNAGNVSFYLNESNANVTITYEDSSTNSSYDGVTTGTNLSSGVHSFSLTGHTSYTIAVQKTGSGSPSIIGTIGRSNTRGVDVNKNPTSPYFGNLYGAQGGLTIYMNNSDLSPIRTNTAGVAWSTSALGPYRIAVASDDFLMVGDASPLHAGVWRLAPDLSSNQLVLGPIGETNGLDAGSFGTIQSRPLLIGSFEAGNAVLMQVDGDIGAGNGYNSLLIYNIGTNALPWTNAPSVYGPNIGIGLDSEALGDNEYPGLTQGPNGYIYASTYRNDLSRPVVQIYDSTGTNILWNSWLPAGTPYPGGTPTSDPFSQAIGTAGPQAAIDSAVSADGNYFIGVSVDNGLYVVPLTNGIPNMPNLFTFPSTSTVGNGRGICWDAADNFYLSSSGIGAIQEWSLGLSATAVTTGNASGTTGFHLVLPSTTVSVVATTNFASQGGTNGSVGTPIPGTFTITRTSADGYASPLMVNFKLAGTAPASAYTASATTSVIIPANEQSVDVTITPTTANVPLPTTTVVLNLGGGAGYTVAAPFSDTVYIQNTSSQLLHIIPGGAPSMYKAFSNDFASIIIERLGDTNASAYDVSNYTLSGTAIAGTDYTLPLVVTFSPGDTNHTNFIYPLVGGQLPVDISTPVYTGNKTITIALGSGGGTYSNLTTTTNLTIIDNADPPAAVLYSDPLTSTNGSSWNITFGNGDPTDNPNDYEVDFGYDLTGNTASSSGFNLALPFPPSGASNALRITCNKLFNPGSAAGVNVYYTNQAFSGDYAVRFNMNLIQGANPDYTTEGVLFGINHGGSYSNWFYESGPAPTGNFSSDGVWYWVNSDPGGSGVGDYIEFTGAGGTNGNTGWVMPATDFWTSYVNVFKVPQVFTTVEPPNGGVPANGSTLNGVNDSNWSDVEIKQIHDIVTLTIDKTPIFVYTNKTVWTNGYLMLGYADPFGGSGGVSVGTPDACAYFSNLRVVQLGPPVITGINIVSNQVVITFVTQDGDDSASSFNLLSSGTAGAAHVDGVLSAAAFTQLGASLQFQVTVPKPTNAAQFYRIQHK